MAELLNCSSVLIFYCCSLSFLNKARKKKYKGINEVRHPIQNLVSQSLQLRSRKFVLEIFSAFAMSIFLPETLSL